MFYTFDQNHDRFLDYAGKQTHFDDSSAENVLESVFDKLKPIKSFLSEIEIDF